MVVLASIYGGIGQGLLYALVAIGIFVTFRVMKYPDLTIEGSFAFGGALAMTLIFHGVPSIIAIIIAMIGGGAAGFLTGIIHTKLKIDGIVVGLLMTMALFSINLFVMGGSANLSAPMDNFVFAPIASFFHNIIGMNPHYANLTSHLVIGVFFVGLVITGLFFLYKTKFGLAIRATGSNENMSRANGINTDTTKITALVIGNAIIALAGSLIAQHRSNASVTAGAGILVIGLAALVIGEVFMPKKSNFLIKFLCIVAGAVIFIVIRALILLAGLHPDAFRIITAAVTLTALCVPKVRDLILVGRKPQLGEKMLSEVDLSNSQQETENDNTEVNALETSGEIGEAEQQ